MKRWITALLVLLTAIMFTACGNSNAEKPGATDSADIARDIAAAEVLGDTLATAYENGTPPMRNCCMASAQPMLMLQDGTISGLRYTVIFGGATISMRVTNTVVGIPK